MCWKLIRDRLADELRARGVPVWRIEDPEELRAALVAKLFEEAYELAKARGREALEEAADLLEALLALLRLEGFGLEELLAARDAKRRERGGFDAGYAAQVGCGEA